MDTPRWTHAALCVATAATTSGVLLTDPWSGPGFHFSWDDPTRIVAEASPLLLLIACSQVFLRLRLGYSLALLGSLATLPWLLRTEFSNEVSNSWIALNYVETVDS